MINPALILGIGHSLSEKLQKSSGLAGLWSRLASISDM